jgi:Periplasmic binding protein domain
VRRAEGRACRHPVEPIQTSQIQPRFKNENEHERQSPAFCCLRHLPGRFGLGRHKEYADRFLQQDALNGAIKQAIDAGIVIVSFDGIVTEPGAYRVVVDFKDYGQEEVNHLAGWLPKGGNLLEIRGLAGTSIDDAIHSGIAEGVRKNPQFKIVNSVEGDWDQTTAQKAVATVLPSLPEIVGIVDQGGDGYGSAQAFLAGGRKLPTIIMGTGRTSLPSGRNRKPRTGIQRGRRPLHLASRPSPSGLPNRSLMVAKTFRTI